jgi:hypothetical protein
VRVRRDSGSKVVSRSEIGIRTLKILLDAPNILHSSDHIR